MIPLQSESSDGATATDTDSGSDPQVTADEPYSENAITGQSPLQSADRQQSVAGPSDICIFSVRNFCADAIYEGPDAVPRCMLARAYQLSDVCQKAIILRLQPVYGSKFAQNDSGTADGRHRSRVKRGRKGSSAAQGQMAEQRPAPDSKTAVDQVFASCTNEGGLFCNDIKEENGELLRCLMRHQDDAVADCRSALENAKTFVASR
jgi:hypothetical protein